MKEPVDELRPVQTLDSLLVGGEDRPNRPKVQLLLEVCQVGRVGSCLTNLVDPPLGGERPARGGGGREEDGVGVQDVLGVHEHQGVEGVGGGLVVGADVVVDEDRRRELPLPCA